MSTILDHLDADVIRQTLPRREALRRVGQIGVGIGLASIPTFGIVGRALAATSQRVHGVLNFALTLEYLEESFYRQGLAASGLIPASDRAVFSQIQKHEDAHVQLLTGAVAGLGEEPVVFTDDDFDFTVDGAFDPFGDYATFMALAQGFEDTGVRAYKGQAANLYSDGSRVNPTLTTALQIHSVEARHASQVRRMRGEKGWITRANTTLPAAFAAIYAGEGNTNQGGVDVGSVSSVGTDGVTEAFDEILTKEEVIAIADPFVIPPLG